MPRARQKLLLTLLAAAAFLPFLGARDIVTSHEARVVQTARAMAESGWPWSAKPVLVPVVRPIDPAKTGGLLRLEPDPAAPPLHANPWLVPVLNDQIRLQKPPLPYWCAAILFKTAGHWSEALARLTPALLGALSTLLIYDLARRLIGRRAAAPAAFVWVSSYFLPDEFRKTMADPYLAFFSLLAIWGWIRGTTASLLACYIAIGLAFLAKGPVLFIHVAIPLLLYHVLHRRRLPGTIMIHLLGVAIALALAAPWYLYILKTVPHAKQIWQFESIGELTDNLNNVRPWWYYPPNLFMISLPWTALWLIGIVVAFRRRAFLPVAWFFGVVLFFSFVNLKKNAYLLPVMPALTLLVAQGLVVMIAAVRRRGSRSPAAWLLAAQSAVAMGFAILAAALVSTKVPMPVWFLGGLAPLLAALQSMTDLHHRRSRDWLTLVACAYVLAISLFFNGHITTTENFRRSPRPAATFIAARLEGDPEATVVPAKLPAEATVYLPLDLQYNPRARRILYLLEDRAPTDPNAFAERLPAIDITEIRQISIPRASSGYRWKLFILTVSGKTLAQND